MKQIIYIITFVLMISIVSAIYEIRPNSTGISSSDALREILKEDKTCLIVREGNASDYYSEMLRLQNVVLQLQQRITVLELQFDITKEPELTAMYECSTRDDEECPGGLSAINKAGLQTRCYNPLMIGWKTCSTGWRLKNERTIFQTY